MTDLKCEICDNVFSTISAKNKHQRTARYCVGTTNSTYECACGHKTPFKYNFQLHQNICTGKDIITDLREKLDDARRLIEILQADIKSYEGIKERLDESQRLNEIFQTDVNDKDLEIEAYEEKIKKLKAANLHLRTENLNLLLEREYGKGQITVYENIPAKTTNNYVNSKLTNVKCDTIRPFTIETVKEDIVRGGYTFDIFLKGVAGLTKFVLEATTLDDQRSYVCTDSSRNKFHRLLESRKWKDDNGASFLNSVFDELRPKSLEHYNAVVAMTAETPNDGEEDLRDYNDILLQRAKPIFFGIKDPEGSEARLNLLNRVRAEVKKMATI